MDNIKNNNIEAKTELAELCIRSYTNEKQSLEKKYLPTKDVSQKKSVPFYKLFRFTEGLDKSLFILMAISSAAIGICFPFNIVIFRNVVNILVSPKNNLKYVELLQSSIIHFAILASATFISGFVNIICISIISYRQCQMFKTNYFSALLRQEINWFDKQQTGQMITKLTNDIDSIVNTISSKLAQFIQQMVLILSSLIISACIGWKLTFVGCISMPLMCIIFFSMIHFMKKYSLDQVKAYSVAGGIAEEILGNVRTVFAYNAQEREVNRYTSNLHEAEILGIKKAVFQGFGIGSIGLIIFSVGSLVFYLGFDFILNENYDPGSIIQVYLSIVVGSVSFGNSIPIIENFIVAKIAAYSLFEIIDANPKIDYLKPGVIPETFQGDISFRNVSFEYPTRPGVQILNNFNFTIPYGKTVAFIGPSGSGKSTIVHLLQRLYDPINGSIFLGNNNLKDIDLNWYRSNIGVVHQEPPLFSVTIRENIQLGNLNTNEEDIILSTKHANAYDFIMKTKDKFDTQLGDRGKAFSGGQKQRIAIATALIRDPELLLLDEATSALDTESEKVVNFNRSMSQKQRTIVVIAHRLETIKNADIIVVMKNGAIVEQGNHVELVFRQGLYWKMIKEQKMEGDEEKDEITVDKMSDVKEEIPKPISTDDSISLTPTEIEAHFHIVKNIIRLIAINKQEVHYLIIGLFSTVLTGITFPFASLIYAQMYQVFTLKHTNPEYMLKRGHYFCGLLLLPAFILFVFQILKNSCLGKAGEVLTRKLRSMMIHSMLKQEIAWFDKPENLPGVLTARLASEVSLAKGQSGIQISFYIEAISCLIASLVIGFYFSWQLTLLFFIFIPTMIILGIIQGRLQYSQEISSSASISSSALVLEVLNNIRTVNSLGLQRYFIDKYQESIKVKQSYFVMFRFGLLNGFGISALFYAYCIVFYVGAVLIDQNQIGMIHLMRVFACFTMSSTAIGRALSLLSDSTKVQEAVQKTLATIDRKTAIDDDVGLIPNEKSTGTIEFRNVSFKYPTRSNIPILQGFNLKIKPLESVAIVGRSGCGKSTVIQLLERYYDPNISNLGGVGQILLDGVDLTSLNLKWVRNQMGIVRQEPILFNLSILDNIHYGSKEPVDIEHVISVSKMANIHDFIDSLPEKYNTIVGPKGCQLSGGQKQRVSIARALYKKPVILLLDEATSALDTQNEILVQEALERAQSFSTTIVIAHRLSTIKNCDQIAFISNGCLVELGSHDELMELRGNYYRLVMGHEN